MSFLLLIAFFAVPGSVRVDAQGPGTLPPPGLFDQANPWPEQLQGIQPEAFLFQDESNTPVVMPRMSFEEIDRLRKLDRGMRSGDRAATLERLAIDGTVEPTRAHWRADLIVRLESAAVRELAGRSVVVDLGFAGAHLIEAADVRFVRAGSLNGDTQQDVGSGLADPSGKTESSGENQLSGKIVPGAYVRLPPPSEFSVVGRSGTGPELSETSAVLGPIPANASDSSSLPTTFPGTLRQAIGNGGNPWSGAAGYQLVIPAESVLDPLTLPGEPPLIRVKLKMSARLWSTPPRQAWLPVQLPQVPTTMQMRLRPIDDDSVSIASLDVVGSGREVVRRIESTNVFVIECDGGLVALRWVAAAGPSGDAGDLIEVESETQLQWESPTEPPSMDVRLMARNLRGPLGGCEIRLPAAAVLVSPPEVIATSSDGRDAAGSGATNGTADASLWNISITRSGGASPDENASAAQANNPAANGGDSSGGSGGNGGVVPATKINVRWAGGGDSQAPSSVRLRLQLRQFPPEATAADPWVLTVPQVAGAIGHRGQVTIRTAGDHRLRWRPRLGIDAIVSQQAGETSGELVYPFRFTQTRFELPVWLSGKQQQIRLTGEAELQVTRRAARVQIDLRAGSGGIDPKGLRLETGPWRLLGITTESRNASLEISTTGELVEWQVDTPDGKWPERYRITAELLASATTDDFKSLVLPRVLTTDASTVLSDVQLTVVDGRRESWLVDLAESPTLQRIGGQTDSKFRILSPESPWTLTGSFASRPLQLQWTGEVAMTQTSDRWLSRSVWTITSPLDLEGRLRFSIPHIDPVSDEARSASGDPSNQSTDESDDGETSDLESSSESIYSESDAGEADPGNDAADTEVDEAGQWLATVDGGPAIVRSAGPSDSNAFAGSKRFEIVSPRLDSGTHRIELVFQPPIVASPRQLQNSGMPDSPVSRGEIASLITIPSPVADQVDLKAPLRVEMPIGVTDSSGGFWRVLPESDGVLGNLREAGRFEWMVESSSGETSSGESSLDDAGVRTNASDRANRWTFRVLPDFPIPVVLRSRVGEERLTEIPRSYLRSLVGKQFRHEHLLASVRGGRRVRLGLPATLQTIRVEVMLDGVPVASTRDATGLRIDLPERNEFVPLDLNASEAAASGTLGTQPATTSSRTSELSVRSGNTTPDTHLLDVRIWTEEPNNPWWSRCEPLIRLPVGSGLQYWQLVVPADSHLFWASSESGKAMRWERDRLRMARVPAISDAALIRWALDLDWQLGDGISVALPQRSPNASGNSDGSGNGVSNGGVAGADRTRSAEAILQAAIRESMSNSTFTVPGNRYLFFAGNVFSFNTITVSRTILWLAVGGLVLLLAAAFQWFPSLHHPLVAFVLAIALAGLLVVAPDGVVLTAQLVMISLTLVAVFYAVSAVAVPRTGQRVLQSRGSSRDSVSRRSEGSRHSEGARRGDGSRRGESPLAPGKSSGRDSRESPTETQDFDPRYQPAAADSSPSGMPTASLAKPASPGKPDSLGKPAGENPEDAPGGQPESGSDVLDVSDPGSSEAVR
ncbi:ICP22 family protein [Rhodopirellula sallentina]|uniref:Putative membrane protein n=1 Tax=Rhodopirellula sallentina SM41 TaxID=1263870 RepID=M5UKL8_9BACT|nr:hypothetical protein [Rhodopirellula sallentina]EMI58401.1 putative membrane protein [Rhodopirellula sallentina SM41]